MGILCKKTSSKQAAAGNIKLWHDLNGSETTAPLSLFTILPKIPIDARTEDWGILPQIDPSLDSSLMNDACGARVIRSGNDKSAMTRSS